MYLQSPLRIKSVPVTNASTFMNGLERILQPSSQNINFNGCVQLQKVYSVRSKAIQACVDETSANVSQLSAARDSNPNNRDEIVKQLRKEQTKVCIWTHSVKIIVNFASYSLD